MALSLPTHLTFNLPHQNLQTHLQVLNFKRPSRIFKTTSSSFFLAAHFYPSVKINFTGLTRACSDGGGDELDASTSSVSSQLHSYIYVCVCICPQEYDAYV